MKSSWELKLPNFNLNFYFETLFRVINLILDTHEYADLDFEFREFDAGLWCGFMSLLKNSQSYANAKSDLIDQLSLNFRVLYIIFNKAKGAYEESLRNSGYDSKMEYIENTINPTDSKVERKRTRNVTSYL